jgi:murein DD-endopeptidase MepM/ murein hydrolase activator NlpD
MNASISQLRSQLNSTRSNRSAVELEIFRLDIELEVAYVTYDHYTDMLEWAYRELEILEADLGYAREDYNEQYELFTMRVRDLNENNTFGLNYLQIFLNSASITDALNNAEIISSLMEQDRNLTDQLKAKQEYLAWKLDEVEVFRAEYELLVIEQEIIANEIEERAREKQELWDRLVEKEATLNQMISDMNRENDSLESMIIRLQEEEAARNRANNPYVGGELLFPLPGYRIGSGYGMRTHPITKKYQMHHGADIGAPRGTSILAANSGKVIYADWNGGYGMFVLIDHGGGMTTGYAHCSAILVKVGQTVARGETIARVGTTGTSTGNHLHFEVRIDGKSQNPENYVKGNN